MSTALALAIYTPFAAITVGVLVIEMFRRFKRQEDYLFTILCLCIALWFASDIASLLVSNYGALRFLYNFKIIFVGLVPPVLLLFVLRFYKVDLGGREKAIRWMLFGIPLLNIPVALTSALHSWMIDIQVIAMLPYRELSIRWGPWFWVHTLQSYVVSLVIISVVVVRHFRMPRFYRLPSSLMAIGILLTLVGNIITLLQWMPAMLDPTLITCSLSMILFDLAIINNNKSKFVRFSHKRIIHYLGEYILILDETQRVLEWNLPAQQWFASRGIVLKDMAFPSIMDALMGQEGAAQHAAEDGKSTDIHLPDSDFPVVLNLRIHKITDANDADIGSIAVFTDITQTWTLIRQLEVKAGVDSLTGIPNHMAYVGAKNRLNAPEHLPLSALVCDVNGLKQVNDNLGHPYGDLLIRVIAQVLEQHCTRPHFVARTGGDEFICLMPNTPTEAAAQKAAEIQEALASIQHYPFPVSLAVGVATKQRPKEEIDAIIAQADSNMYENKKQLKGGEAAAVTR